MDNMPVTQKNIKELSRLPYRTYNQAELEAGYKAMAADDEYEREAMEWCNGLMSGVEFC